MGLMILVKLLAIFVCTLLLINTIVCLYRGNHSVQFLFYIIFYVFFVFPIILQLLIPYKYALFYKANAALGDLYSVTIYCIFIILFSVAIYRSGKQKKEYKKKLACNKTLLNFCGFIVIATLMYTIFTNGISILFAGYGARLSAGNYSINEMFFNVAMIAFLIIIGNFREIKNWNLVTLSAIFFLLVWIHGKRFILAEFLIMAVFTLFLSNNISGRQLVKGSVLLGVFIIVFAYSYGQIFRQNSSSLLEYVSIDLSRHYTLIYQIYCSRNNIAISVGSFDAIIFLLLFWMPRSIWANKPYPFVNSLTRSLLGLSPENINLGWATTCSIFSDLFDSLSYFGLLLGILLIGYLSKRINKTGRLEYKVLGIYTVINLLTVQMSASLPCIFVCLILFFVIDWITDYNSMTKNELGEYSNVIVT